MQWCLKHWNSYTRDFIDKHYYIRNQVIYERRIYKMSLQKLSIEPDTGDRFEVLFNPNEYTISDGAQWGEQSRQRSRPILQFTASQRKSLSMTLFLDSSETDEDVRSHTRKVAALLKVDRNADRPPICTINWGTESSTIPHDADFPFIGVLKTLRQQFIYFNSDGVPLRAKLTAEFTQFELPEDELKREQRRHSFPAKTYTAIMGDSLSGIAGNLWKDPRLWRLIAKENKIDNPRDIQAGQVLIIPAIKN